MNTINDVIQEINKLGLDLFVSQYKLNMNKHKEKDIFILNYDQIDSPRHNNISDYCRGLVIEKKDEKFYLVARSFKRFYNYLEKPNDISLEEYHKFFESKFESQRKEDGSIIMIFYHEDQWFINTRSSFGDAEISHHNKINGADLSVKTYKEAVKKLVNLNNLDKTVCYVCEYVGPTNKHIMKYDKDQLILLACFCKDQEIDLVNKEEFSHNQTFQFNNLEEVLNYIKLSRENVEEGLVLKSLENGKRIKFKTQDYFALHKVKNNGFIDNDYIVYKVLSNEMFELRAVFPEFSEKFDRIETITKQIVEQSKEIVEKLKELDQKQFALSVKHLKISSVLFSLRKNENFFRENIENAAKVIEKLLPADNNIMVVEKCGTAERR